MSTVNFFSEGVRCEGDIYFPPDFNPASKHPALVIGHGFGVLRTSLVEEGRQLAHAGYVTLAIDYRHFGGSDGSPRHRLYPLNEVEDFRAAIDWLEHQPGVDSKRLGVWGTSFGGGIVTYVAANDLRVRACVAQAPILDGDHWIRSLNRESDYLAIRQYLLGARRGRAAGAAAQSDERYIPVGPPAADGFTPMPIDPVMVEDSVRWFEQTGRKLLDTAPELTLQSFERVMQFDAVRAAGKIAPRAYCIVQLTGRDIYHPQRSIQEAFKEAGEPKHMASIRLDQLDCYKPEGRRRCLDAAIAFLDRHLK